MKKTFIRYASLAIILLGTVSCSTRLADLTIASTKNMDLNAPRGYQTATNKRVQGVDKVHVILFFPMGNSDVKEAIDKAIEHGGNNCVALSNATLTQKWWYIPLIYGQFSLVAEGDPIFKN